MKEKQRRDVWDSWAICNCWMVYIRSIVLSIICWPFNLLTIFSLIFSTMEKKQGFSWHQSSSIVCSHIIHCRKGFISWGLCDWLKQIFAHWSNLVHFSLRFPWIYCHCRPSIEFWWDYLNVTTLIDALLLLTMFWKVLDCRKWKSTDLSTARMLPQFSIRLLWFNGFEFKFSKVILLNCEIVSLNWKQTLIRFRTIL